MPTPEQGFQNHGRVVPAYHMAVFFIFLFNLGFSIYRVAAHPSWAGLDSLLLAIAFLLLFVYARRFALTVQDRVIRLEMRLRLQRVLPGDLSARIGELSVGQLIALRFASDEELPELTRTVLEQRLNDRKAIKRMVKNWQADHLRV